MADLKISQLPAASTPLAGTEVLPVVQGGVTEQVSVADLTAGRAIAATSLTVGAGAVGTPSLTTSGDLNTGVWFPASDTVAISEGGVEALRINSSAEVIVGNGDAVASPNAGVLRGTDGSGTDVAGGNLTIQAGRGTGTGAGGSISFATSPAGTSGSTLQTATERVRIDSAGRVGIGGAPEASDRILVKGALSGGTNAYAFRNAGEVNSEVTADAYGFNSNCTSAASSFTINRMIHFGATQIVPGSSSTVTSQLGFSAGGLMTAATNNYGFYGSIPSGTGRYNFYAAGTADNYFAGTIYSGGDYVQTKTSGFPVILAQSIQASGYAPPQIRMFRIGASSSATPNDSKIGEIRFDGLDANAQYRAFGLIDCTIGTNASGGAPSAMRFYTSFSGNDAVERMRIDDKGFTQFSSNLVMPCTKAPTSKSAGATLSGAELVTGMLQYTGGAATVNLPTGTDIEGASTWAANDVSLDWFVINTGSGTCTIGANGNTTVGTLTVTAGTSAHFRIRRTAANTFTIYRL